jgi:uncharacterized protein (TIGR02147 family)
MNLFTFSDYRAFLKATIKTLPRNGRGELSKISRHLNVNSTLISQIMAGSRDFTTEQAYELCLYFGLSDLETEYFNLLVAIEKAGTQKLKEFLRKRLATMRAESLKLSRRVDHEKKLSQEDMTTFYSSWRYSAIRLYCSTSTKGKNIEEIAEKFLLTKARAVQYLRFLTKTGLCTEAHGRYQMGVQRTFVEQGSPHLLKHHSNWRLKALQKSEAIEEDELMFTGPMSLSREDFRQIREEISKFLSGVSKRVKDSAAEEIACLNIDFFHIEK